MELNDHIHMQTYIHVYVKVLILVVMAGNGLLQLVILKASVLLSLRWKDDYKKFEKRGIGRKKERKRKQAFRK